MRREGGVVIFLAFMSPEFCNFIALAAEWMGGLSGAEQYVRFIAKWGVTGGK